eukprot:gene12319-16523_t
MPDVYFIGEISHTESISTSAISVTWAIVPGNTDWNLKSGISFGETQTCLKSDSNESVLNHPIDLHFHTSSSEGWPVIVYEVWDRTYEESRNFVGCGSVWLPIYSNNQHIIGHVWRPVSHGLNVLGDLFIDSCPDFLSIRELSIDPFLRSTLKVESVGTIHLNLNILTCGFESFGVNIANSESSLSSINS